MTKVIAEVAATREEATVDMSWRSYQPLEIKGGKGCHNHDDGIMTMKVAKKVAAKWKGCRSDEKHYGYRDNSGVTTILVTERAKDDDRGGINHVIKVGQQEWWMRNNGIKEGNGPGKD